MKKKKKFSLINSATVPVMFIVICAIAIALSGFSANFLVSQVLTRFARNAFLVLSLLLPIMAGLGINFGMVLGAMAGQIAIILIENWGIPGFSGVLLSAVVATPIAWLLGIFAGSVLNRAKEREMITSMMLGFFMTGIYQFIVLYIFGGVIKFKNTDLIISRGYGVRNALDLKIQKGLDTLLDRILGVDIKLFDIQIPVVTLLVIALGCLFVVWFRKTKLGQDMRAVGQDMKVAEDAGINVNKTRLKAVVLSTIMAAYGQIIYLQNIGNLNTYNGADQAATYAAAALLIGGASVSKATITNALTGTILFHLMFIVMPTAGAKITGNSMIGEYLRTFVSYAVVTITLILHSVRRAKERNEAMESLRVEPVSQEK
ncbi:MAG: ABC transporter permease [Ezakiella sp.]|nr:ABC transporter permease [Ezakiella sp.]MDD7761655.1 ABC transporter permease [Bacillota bacterium]MDY3947485.1 ABC transporter permease [Ezakiella sp.]